MKVEITVDGYGPEDEAGPTVTVTVEAGEFVPRSTLTELVADAGNRAVRAWDHAS